MVNFREALKGAVRDSVSSMLDVADTALSYGRALSYLAEQYSEAANWLRRQIGDVPPGEELPPLEEAFQGGQCPVQYDITTSGTNNSGNPSASWTDVTVRVTGPIGSPVFYDGSTNGVFVENGSGVLVPISPTTSPFFNYSLTSISMVRVDGLPDNCGESYYPGMPDPIPTEGIPGDITIIWDDRDNVTHTEEGDITIYAPVISIDGSINIPLTIDVGGITLDGSLDVTNNLEVTVNPRAADKISPRPTIDLPMPPDIPDGGDPVNLVLARNAISGVVVRSTVGSNVKATQVGQDGAPTLFLPRLANLYFVYRVGDSFAWSEPFPIVHINQLVPVPFDFSAYAYYIWEEYDVDCMVYPLSSNLVPLIPEP